MKIESLAKAEVADMLKTCKGEVLEVLELRQVLSKSRCQKICSNGDLLLQTMAWRMVCCNSMAPQTDAGLED